MRLFNRHNSNDVLYLTPIQVENDQLPADKIRVLYCDTKGNIGAAVIENSVYELAKGYVEELERAHKNCVTLSMEIAPGESVPFAVEISSEQAYALDNILEHALKSGRTPDILKKYPKEIIKLGEGKREELKHQHTRAEHYAISGATPEVLNRLSGYPEDSIEVAIPIYKAAYRYPIVILKRLLPNEQTNPNMQRLLILDSDGDLAIIKVPLGIIDEAERAFEEWKKANNSDGCVIYSRYPDGFMMSHMEITGAQKKALDMIVQHFEETGHGEQPIPVDVQVILTRARALKMR
ncbi:hypothetical protein ACFLTK_01280 [Chloroflexota bacterium]